MNLDDDAHLRRALAQTRQRFDKTVAERLLRMRVDEQRIAGNARRHLAQPEFAESQTQIDLTPHRLGQAKQLDRARR